MTADSIISIKSFFGFNPCFGGSYIMTPPCGFLCLFYKQFQSLFWWILYYDQEAQTQKPIYIVAVSILVLVDLIL